MSKRINTHNCSVNLHDFKARNRQDNARRQARAQTPLRNDWRERLTATEHSDVGAVVVGAIVTGLVIAAVVTWHWWQIMGEVGK